MRALIRLTFLTVAVLVASFILPGVTVTSVPTAIVVAVVLAVVNAVVKPILVVLTLPATLVTLGLFLFVINALMVLLVTWIVPGFAVANFWWALLFSLVVSAVSWFLDAVAGES